MHWRAETGAKAGERLAGLQAKVDQFVTCLNGQGLEVEGIDVSALREQRTLAHRGGRGGHWGYRGLRRRGSTGKVARLAVRASSLDRTDEAVRDAVQVCRQAELDSRAADRQNQVNELVSCLEGKGYADVENLDVTDRPRLAARRGFLGRVMRMIAKDAGLDRTDATVRADLRSCRDDAKAAATA